MQKCLNCQKEFEPDRSVAKRKKPKSLNEGKFCSLSCAAQYNAPLKRIQYVPNVKCTYCTKEFYITSSKLKNSKSGLYFCCREHKDLAQRIEFQLKEIWPDHYDGGHYSFRDMVLRTRENKCECCGYDKFISVLEVHHIDRNRHNNDLINLKLLCPTCHQEEHFKTKTGRFSGMLN